MIATRKKYFYFLSLLLMACAIFFAVNYVPRKSAGINSSVRQDASDLDWHRPGQWVVVNYWASWCSYCKHEVPELNDLSALGVKVIGISAVPVKQAEVEAWRTVAHATYPLLKAAPESLNRRVGRVDRLPTTYLIDPEGTFIGPFVGSVTKAELQRHMK